MCVLADASRGYAREVPGQSDCRMIFSDGATVKGLDFGVVKHR
jgi:hypothetical protein